MNSLSILTTVFCLHYIRVLTHLYMAMVTCCNDWRCLKGLHFLGYVSSEELIFNNIKEKHDLKYIYHFVCSVKVLQINYATIWQRNM